MKFLELHLDGFGKLVDRTFTFAPGLNLVFGLNEAGKSTLQQALLTLLYGFYEEGSVTRAKQEAAKSLVPWAAGAGFSGWLVYRLDDSREFRAVRSFSGRPVTNLQIAADGRDVSCEYRSASQGRLFFANAQLGMSKAVFENTCVVRQAELIALEQSAGAITDTLMRLSSSDSQDTTTADALAILDRALRDDIGTDRAWTRPLGQARQRLEKLQASQEQAATVRREAFALISELKQEQGQLEELEREIERLHYLATLAEWQAIQGQLDASAQADVEAQRLAAEVERWRPWAEFPYHLRDEVIRLEAECTQLARAIAEHAEPVKQAQLQRADLTGRLNAVETEVAALVGAREVEAEQLPLVQKLVARWEAAQAAFLAAGTRLSQEEERLAELEQALAREQAALGHIVDLGPLGLAQLQQRWLTACDRDEQARTILRDAHEAWRQVGQTDEQYHDLAVTAKQIEAGTYVEESPRTGCKFWGRSRAPEALPPETAIYAQVKPIRDRWEAARAQSSEARAVLVDVEREVKNCLNLESGEQPNQAHFESANQSLGRYTPLSSEVQARQEAVRRAGDDVGEAHRRAASARDTLVQALTRLGCSTDDLEKDVRVFERLCQQKAQYDRATAELRSLRGEDRVLVQEEQAQAEREKALGSAGQALRARLIQSGINVTEGNLQHSVAEFEEQFRYHQQWGRAQDRYQAALHRPASGLTQVDREAARRRLASLEQQLEGWRASETDWVSLRADHDAHDYRERGHKLEASCQTKRERCTQLRESLQRITAGLTHPAELAEQIAGAEAQIRRMEYLRDVLSLARDELAATTEEYQRGFAPRLERLVADGLRSVTQGRYGQVGVDPSSLGLTVVVPEREEPVAAEQLSTGTRELIYLLLRIGVARLMSRTHETLPLLLDDPLVQLDRRRQEQFLGLLAELAKETQVFLFTKDDDLLQWFRRELGDSGTHHLSVLE